MMVFPLLGVVQNGPQVAADRYTYQAAMAFTILAGAALLAVPERWASWSLGLGAALVAALGALSWRQTATVWRDERSIWSQVVRLDSASTLGRHNLENAIAREGKAPEVDAEIARYQAAVGAAVVVEAPALRVQVVPNPSTSFFTLQLQGAGTQPIAVRVVDALGRLVEVRQVADRCRLTKTALPEADKELAATCF